MELPDDPAQLTDDQRADLIGYALTDTDGSVTRWVVAAEQATDGGFTITSRATDDAPWILLGLAHWLTDTLVDEARGRN